MGWKRFYIWVWHTIPWRICICLFPPHILFTRTWHIFSFCQDTVLKENFLNSEEVRYLNSVKQMWTCFLINLGCMRLSILQLRAKLFSLYHSRHNFLSTFKYKNIETKGVTITYTPPTGYVNTNPPNFTNYSNTHKSKSQFFDIQWTHSPSVTEIML